MDSNSIQFDTCEPSDLSAHVNRPIFDWTVQILSLKLNYF
jgi:hypothetical protein